MDATGKILFNCPSCGYRAKIPGHYLGMSIRCPGCNGSQMVEKPTDKAAETTGKTVSITRVATTPLPFTVDEAKQPAPVKTAPAAHQNVVTRTPLPGSLNALAAPAMSASDSLPSGSDAKGAVIFTCSTCAYRARIPSSYAGKNIHCPKCNATQTVPVGAAAAPSTGQTVSISKVATATPAFGTPVAAPASSFAGASLDTGLAAPETAKTGAAQMDLSDKILFTCPACKMRARIPAKYAGSTIKCPKCQIAGTVPLSDVVEAATGNTVSISRVEIAKGKAADERSKRSSGEIAMPAASAPASASASASASATAAAKRPSGEIALSELSNRSSPAAPASPFAEAPAAESPDSEDFLEDLGSKPQAAKDAGKKGVIKRRGSQTNLPTPAAATTTPPKPAAKRQPTPAPAKHVTPPPAAAEEPPARSESKSAGKAAPARRPAPVPSKARASDTADEDEERDDEASAAKGRGLASKLPMILGAVLLLSLIVSGVMIAKLQSANASTATVQGQLDQMTRDRDDQKKKADAASGRADKAEAQVITLKADVETAQGDAAKQKKDAETQKSDFEKRIADLESQLAEKVKALEAALAKPEPKDPKKK